MNRINRQKILLVTAPELKDDGAPTIAEIDTAGYSRLRVLFSIGVTDIATTAAPTLTEGDTSGGSFTAITGAALADAISATEDGKMFAIDLNLINGTRKRFILPTFVCGDGTAGTNVAIHAILDNQNSGTNDGLAAGAGLEELVSV